MRGPRARVPEKTEQAHGVQLLRSLGAKVYVLGTVRAKGDHPGTRQTPGLPDVEAFIPVRGAESVPGEVRQRMFLKWECKAVGGRLRPEQREYQELCAGAHVAHVVGTFDALIAWLAARGFVKAQSFPEYRQPRTAP